MKSYKHSLISRAAGTGSGCVYQSVCTAVPVYFEKYRSGTLCVVTVLRHCCNIRILIPKVTYFSLRNSFFLSAALGVVSAAAAVGQFVYPFIIPPLVNPVRLERINDRPEWTHIAYLYRRHGCQTTVSTTHYTTQV